MAKEKKPSIYVDRGTIGSSDELDEYGVWVKSEPQDLSSTGIETDEISSNNDTDFEIPDMDGLPDFDTLQPENLKDTATDYDFELPDMEPASGEEDNDSDIFNFGDLTEQVAEETLGETDSGILTDSVEELDLPNFTEITDDLAGFSETPVKIKSDENTEESGEEKDFTEISMDNFLGNVDSVSEEPQEALTETAEEPEIQDIVDFDSLSESFEEAGPPPAAQPAMNIVSETHSTAPDLPTQLLMKIAEELASIRTELSSLKKEFSGIKVAAAEAVETKEGSYLGEEDDEKIALTGDELNNILNTADFTEEAGADATIELSESLAGEEEDTTVDPVSADSAITIEDLDMEIDLGKTNLEEPIGDTKLGYSETLDQSDDLEFSELPGFTSEDTEGLSEIQENGVEPMAFAPAPEDTDYLENDPLAVSSDESPLEDNLNIEEIPEEIPVEETSEELHEESAEDSIDLSGAVIDEPDLSSEIQDNPLEEPSLDDISISLDLTDLDTIELDASESDLIESESPEFGELDSVELSSAESSSAEDFSTGDLPPAPEGLTTETSKEIFIEAAPAEVNTEFALEDFQSLPEESEEEPILEEALETLEIEEETLEEIGEPLAVESVTRPVPEKTAETPELDTIPSHLKHEIKTVLSYMDQLLEALPDDKIEEFARSEHYDTYKKLFQELGLV
jgi:hypothetical protein